MNNNTLITNSVCLAALVFAPVVMAAEKKATASPSPISSASAAAKTDTSSTKARSIPFHGMVSAVDKTAKTFTIAGKDKSRVFKVTDKTVITKVGQPAKITDITENVELSGSYWKTADGSLEAQTVRVGPMSEKKTTKKEKAGASPATSASPSASPKASPKKM